MVSGGRRLGLPDRRQECRSTIRVKPRDEAIHQEQVSYELFSEERPLRKSEEPQVTMCTEPVACQGHLSAPLWASGVKGGHA